MSKCRFLSLSLVVVQTFICMTARASVVDFSYTYGDSDFEQIGTSKDETYDIAIRLSDPSFRGARIKSFSVPFVESDNISNISVWASSELILENKVNIPDIASVEAVCVNGNISVTFPQTIEIPEGGLYVGYTFSVDSKDEVTTAPVIVAGEPMEDGLYLHTNRTYIKWKSYASAVGHSSAITVTLEGDFKANALGVVSVKDLTANPGQPSILETTLINHGSEPISSISYEVAGLNDAERLEYEFGQPVDLYFGQTMTVDLPFVAPDLIDEYPINLKITGVNGEDNYDVMNSANGTLVVLDEKPVHKPLMEEYTGFWCGYCPRGFAALERMNSLHPDEFVAISYHSGDELQTTNSFPNRVDGLPAAVMDRTHDIDAYFGVDKSSYFGIETFWQSISEDFTPAFVNGVALETEDRSIIVTSDVKFILSAFGSYKVAYAIVANGLSDTDWGQTNYYSGVDATGYVPEMEKFCNGGREVYGLIFDDVFAAGSNLKGEEDSLIENVVRNETYSHSFIFGKDDGISFSGYNLFAHAKDLYAVIILLDENGAVVNSNKVPVKRNDTSLSEVKSGVVAKIDYYDMNGRHIINPTGGIYLKVTTMENGSQSVSKIIIP